MMTELVFPFATPSLNETKSEHWRKKTARRTRYERYIWAARCRAHPGPVRVEIHVHRKRKLDHDNFVGGAKDLIDAFVRKGVIPNDTEEVIGKPLYEQYVVKQPHQIMTIVRIIDL